MINTKNLLKMYWLNMWNMIIVNLIIPMTLQKESV